MGAGSSKSIGLPSRDQLLKGSATARSFMDYAFQYMMTEITSKDLLNLGDPNKCSKYILLIGSALERYFDVVQIGPKLGADNKIYFQSIDKLTTGDQHKQICMSLGYFYTRIFQIYAAIYFSIHDDDRIIPGAGYQQGITGLAPPMQLGQQGRIFGGGVDPEKLPYATYKFLANYLTPIDENEYTYRLDYSSKYFKYIVKLNEKSNMRIYEHQKNINNEDVISFKAIFRVTTNPQQTDIFLRVYNVEYKNYKLGPEKFYEDSYLIFLKNSNWQAIIDNNKYNPNRAITKLIEHIKESIDINPNAKVPLLRHRKQNIFGKRDYDYDYGFDGYVRPQRYEQQIKKEREKQREYREQLRNPEQQGLPDKLKSIYTSIQPGNRPIAHCVSRSLQLLNIDALTGFGGKKNPAISYMCSAKFISNPGTPKPDQKLDSSPGLKTLSMLFTTLEGDVKYQKDQPLPTHKQEKINFMNELSRLYQSNTTISDGDFLQLVNRYDSNLCKRHGLTGSSSSGVFALNKDSFQIAKKGVEQLWKIQLDHTKNMELIARELFIIDNKTRKVILHPKIKERGIAGLDELSEILRKALVQYYSKCELTYQDAANKIIYR